MGCGVSKEDFAEPSRIQQVVVRDGSPTKALEVAACSAVNTTPVTQGSTDTIIATPCASPVSLVVADVQIDTRDQETTSPASESPAPESLATAPEILHPETPALEAAPESLLPESPAPDAPPESTEHVVVDETPVLPFPCESSNEGDPCSCSKTPELEREPKGSTVAPSRTSNGLVGTLASLEEILNGNENISINSKVRVTADKIVSYGGVLRSLEDTVELQAAADEVQRKAEKEPETAETAEVEPEAHVENEPEAVPAAESDAESTQTMVNPVENHREEPESPAAPPSAFEAAPKKLPPLEAPPTFLIDKGTDPFVKAPLPTQLTKSVSATTTHDIPVSAIDLTSNGEPSPPCPPHSVETEMLTPDHVKDIKVVNGAPEFGEEKCSSPKEQTSSEGVQSADAELDNIILLETLEAGDLDYGSRVNHINHNIRVTSLTPDLGVSSNGRLSPFSTASNE
ncbi:hypothetical protein R1flu_003114 [Riccia fluitans]|uniref:Uncharacterized protein n=1 Tax=Riccia fluitans TaxID=41844 RepID=A0ABD1YBU7_9MARC